MNLFHKNCKMHKQIVILGSNGMLGHMALTFFKNHGFSLITFDERFTFESFDNYLNYLNSIEDSIIINCIGRIKQKSSDPYELLFANSILPLELSRKLRVGHYLIQPSTDCVFDGLSQKKYKSKAIHTAKDVYGWSKSLGEKAILSRPNSLVIRVSIIGPEVISGNGLLGWFLNLPENSKINGYVNHYWNGITTLEWCKQVHHFIKKVDFGKEIAPSLLQLGTERIYSKRDMLALFNETFDRNIKIIDYSTPQYINRTLESDFKLNELDIQLIELCNFMKTSI